MFKFIITFGLTIYFSFLIHIILSIWQSLPIKEERSTPLYITKELFTDD